MGREDQICVEVRGSKEEPPVAESALNRAEGVLLPLDRHISDGHGHGLVGKGTRRIPDAISFAADLDGRIEVIDDSPAVRLHQFSSPRIDLPVERTTAVYSSLSGSNNLLERPVQIAPGRLRVDCISRYDTYPHAAERR